MGPMILRETAHTGHPAYSLWCDEIDHLLGAGTCKATSPTLLARLYYAGLSARAAARELHPATHAGGGGAVAPRGGPGGHAPPLRPGIGGGFGGHRGPGMGGGFGGPLGPGQLQFGPSPMGFSPGGGSPIPSPGGGWGGGGGGGSGGGGLGGGGGWPGHHHHHGGPWGFWPWPEPAGDVYVEVQSQDPSADAASLLQAAAGEWQTCGVTNVRVENGTVILSSHNPDETRQCLTSQTLAGMPITVVQE